MAYRWSSENIVLEHKDLQANAMALDCTGRFVLLAGRRNVAVIDLENPNEIAKRMTRNQQKYDVSVAEWNPTSQLAHAFVLAVGEKAEIFNWCEGILSNEISLKAHTRTITDLNWHRSNSNLLVTCSIDTFLHIWDTRETRKPAVSLSAIAGASQVKWNKINSNYLASGHDCDIRIWDWRKSTQPVYYITAHLSKIHGLDWSPKHENQIVSSSNDSTVKFFDVTTPRKCEMQINTQSPVWRARYTPFGEGILSVIVPPLRRGENSLLLWSLLDYSAPVHSFVGHSDVVLEFEWRTIGHTNPQELQLVTWSRDNSLRIWGIDPQLIKMCGHATKEDNVAFSEDIINMETSDTETLLGAEHIQDDIKEVSESGSDADASKKHVENLSSKLDVVNISNTVASKREPPKSLDLQVNIYQENLGRGILGTPLSQATNVALLPQNSSASSIFNDLSVGTPSTSASDAVPSQCCLQSEFSSLNNIAFENLQGYLVEITKSLELRSCLIHVVNGPFVADLEVTLTTDYPKSQPPSFRFTPSTNINSTSKRELLKVLNSTALSYFKRRRNCLEPCAKIFITQLKALLNEERSNVIDLNLPVPPIVNSNYFLQMYGGQQDYSIPFPRTSGARFGSTGMLVCFFRPTQCRQTSTRSSRTEPATPRSLSALGALQSLYPQISSSNAMSPKYSSMYPVGQSPSIEQQVSVSMYYNQDRKSKSKRVKHDAESSKIHKAGIVALYDVSKLIPISKDLAEAYILDEEDKIGSCRRNREAALTIGRRDLAQVWSVAATVLSLSPSHGLEDGFPWSSHHFAQKLIMSIIEHYHSRYDVQTAAMLSCLLGERIQNIQSFSNRKEWNSEKATSNPATLQRATSDPPYELPRRFLSKMAKFESLGFLKINKEDRTGGSPYNTIHCTNTEGLDVYNSVIRHNRSNSEGSLAEVSRTVPENSSFIGDNKISDKRNLSFLGDAKTSCFEQIRRAYAEILYRWDLLNKRTEVNKFIRNLEPIYNKGVDFQIDCMNCYQSNRAPQCRYCKKFSFFCSICQLSVRGSSIFCIVCGHGGHSHHYMTWFDSHNKCPTGCGCECLNEMDQLFQ